MLGLRRPEAGEARLFGLDPRESGASRRIGLTPQETAFPDTIKVREILEFVGRHFEQPAPVGELIERFALDALQERQIGGLSGGERRRLAVALAFAPQPEAIFLDEPTAGLDVSSRRQIWHQVRAFAAGGGTVLLTTHDLHEAQELASRIVLIAHGRVVSDGTAAQITEQTGATLEESFLLLTGEKR
jgi:ABC-2 type transport system ATP-binding protein